MLDNVLAHIMKIQRFAFISKCYGEGEVENLSTNQDTQALSYTQQVFFDTANNTNWAEV